MSIPVASARIKTPVPPRADGVYVAGQRGISNLTLDGPMLRIESEREGEPQATVLVPISNVASMTLFEAPTKAEPEVAPEEPVEEESAEAPATEAKPKATRKR